MHVMYSNKQFQSVSKSSNYVHSECNYDKIPMMKNTRKTFIKVLQGLLVLATLITMIVIGIFLWNLVSNTPNDDEPPIVNTEESFEFSIVDYEYFKFEDLDFNVLIATIRLNANYAYNIPLSKLKTSENIFLNDIDSYLSQLQEANYKPSNSGLVFSIYGSDSELQKDFTVFIPVRSKNLSKLTISSLVKPYSEMEFDLSDSSKWIDSSTLKIEDNTVSATDDLSAEFVFMDYYIQSNFYTLDANNKETTVDFPSNSKVLGVKLTINNSNSEILYKINSAKILYPTDQVVNTLDSNIQLFYEVNLLTETLDDTAQGVLFFLVQSDGTNIMTLPKSDLTLILELSNGESVSFSQLIGN